MAALMGGQGGPAMPMAPESPMEQGQDVAPEGMPGDVDPGAGLAFPDQGMGGPMSDPSMMGPPDPMSQAIMLGQGLAAEKEQAHQMIEQASQQQLQQILAMIAQAATGAGVPGADGQIA
jgi:hypothetical protein